jgi:hypothetical protein
VTCLIPTADEILKSWQTFRCHDERDH